MVIRKDWVESQLNDLCNVEMGQSPPSSTYNVEGIGLPFFQGKAEFTDKHPIVRKWCNKPKKVAEELDILLSVRAPVGATNIANKKCAIGRGLAALTYTPCVNYLYYYLNFIEHKLDSLGTGTTFRAISGSVLKTQVIPVAPLPEQRAIVNKIEQLFSELDQGIAHFKTAQKKLELYRQAVLKKAFEGELTKAWREQQTDLPTADELLQQIKQERQQHYQQQLADWEKVVKEWELGGKDGRKPAKPKKLKTIEGFTSEELDSLANLNIGWSWQKLGNICQKIQIGPFGSQLHKHDYVEKGIPLVNPKHIKNNKIQPNERISADKANSLPQYILKENDIILGRRGEMGRTAYISGNESGWFCGTGSLYIRLGKYFNGNLYSWVLSERRAVNYFEEKGSGTTMTNLNSKILDNLPIQIIPPKEQTQIVQEIESRLSVCDKLSETLTSQLEKAEALRQSILKKAFEGRLLSDTEIKACQQEADWEPAEQLLARIKTESAKKPVAKPRKKQTKKKAK